MLVGDASDGYCNPYGAGPIQFGSIVPSVLTPVLAKDSKSFSLIDCISLDGVAADRRFATAYNAALKAAQMCAGHRVAGAGHHRISLDVVRLAIGKAADPFGDDFDSCRRKRNVIDYDEAFVATETEALEIVAKAKEFVDMVEQWMGKTHPTLKA